MSEKLTFKELSLPLKVAAIAMIIQFLVFCGYFALFLYGFGIGLANLG